MMVVVSVRAAAVNGKVMIYELLRIYMVNKVVMGMNDVQ